MSTDNRDEQLETPSLQQPGEDALPPALETPTPGGGERGLGGAGRIIGATVLLIAAAYLPALRGDFLIEDEAVLTRNPHLFVPDGLRRIWFSTESEQYQPLMYTSFWVERHLWGPNAVGYRLVNLTLHAANTVLVWLLLRRLGVKAAAVAALLFAVHPVNVESVAWIYERKNVLSGLFYLLTFGALFRFEDTRRGGWYVAALLLFAAALLTKSSTVVLPAILLLYGWWRGGDLWRGKNVAAAEPFFTGSAGASPSRGWKDVVTVVPFFILAGAMAVLTVWYEKHHTGAVGPEYVAGFVERFARAGSFVAFYLGKFFLPYPLMFFYPRRTVDPTAIGTYLPHAGLVLVLMLCVLQRRTWGRAVLFGLGAYLIALFPVLGFFDIYYFRFAFIADHFQYLPIIGLLGLCVHAASCALERWGLLGTDPVTGRARFGGRELAGLVLAACWFLTWQRAAVFQNTPTLCEDTLRRNPDSWIAHYKLGEYLLPRSQGDEKQLQRAFTHLERAAKLRPDHGYVLSAAGGALRLLQRNSEALDYLRRAVAVDPKNPGFRYNLGAALEDLKDLPGAIAEYEQALGHAPDFGDARVRLGLVLVEIGRAEAGLAYLRAAVERRPNRAGDHLALGGALFKTGHLDEAIEHFKEAARLNPKDARAIKILEEVERTRWSVPASAPASPK